MGCSDLEFSDRRCNGERRSWRIHLGSFCNTPGKVKDGDNGDIACDHYHRYEDDIALMKSLGVNAYRFSIAWVRIFPTGFEDEPNEEGLAFYERLVDAVLAAGLEPWATLYHWDMPQALEDNGGWPSRDTVDHFVRFADAVSKRLGGRVKHWITHNEPWVVTHLGYCTGEHAPGIKSWPKSLAAAHHVLLSHGLATPVIRRNVSGAKVGITLNLCPSEPASQSAADKQADQWFDGFFNRWYLDPVFGKGYPEDMVDDYQAVGHLPNGLDFVADGDLTHIAVPTDFLGINYYSRAVLRSDKIPEEENEPRLVFQAPKSEWTDIGWEVHGPSLKRLLLRLTSDYNPPEIYITENGCAYHTSPDDTGRIRDEKRIAYFQSHLKACEEAIAEGAPLAGYFAWSLMDNFEWAEGYSQRFGLVWVDYDTLERIPKDSAYFYRDYILAQSSN